ncbi:multiple inositol polyphosphate phosphatase 1 [Esox lucius]|uniref:Multiple inositol polyphosphate phosphatase 1 n=2 Tax=Esox lucius TaxID=8010 RepID=A0AAY5KFA5_ESOLU|nr:multiple inositol polyphosphate phosphatase 1 [Esox lucius]
MFAIPIKTLIAHFFFSYISSCSQWLNVQIRPRHDIPAIAKYFTTKGRYEEVNPYLVDDILAVNKSLVNPSFEECREIHLTAIIRHGTRYPTTKNVKKMRAFHNLVQNAPEGESWLRNIRQWKMWYTDEMDGRLVQKGVLDHRHLAVRLSKLFPSLISKENLQGGHIKFITSSKHRCVNSTVSFYGGLGKLWDIEDDLDFKVNDTLMRFFDQCTRFVETVDKNQSALAEVDKFIASAFMRRVQEKLADRLLVPYSNITSDMAEASFYLCAYEFAIKTINSPWCQLLDEEDALVLEYANDLKQFWKRGYGQDINSKSSCILFHDVFSRLDRVASEIRSGSNVTEAVTIQVGHAETLLPLLTLLGFFKDSMPLTSSNYVNQAQRAFRTSRMLPYAANLVLVLYDCNGELRLQAMLNERPIEFPGLAVHQGVQGAPLYQDVREHYKELLQGCNFEKECHLFPSK